MNMLLPHVPYMTLALTLAFGLAWYQTPRRPRVMLMNAWLWALYSVYLLAFPLSAAHHTRWDFAIIQSVLVVSTFASAIACSHQRLSATNQ